MESGLSSKAYDWNQLQRERILYDILDVKPIAVILSRDSSSFIVLEQRDAGQAFSLVNDTLRSGAQAYDILGGAVPARERLEVPEDLPGVLAQLADFSPAD